MVRVFKLSGLLLLSLLTACSNDTGMIVVDESSSEDQSITGFDNQNNDATHQNENQPQDQPASSQDNIWEPPPSSNSEQTVQDNSDDYLPAANDSQGGTVNNAHGFAAKSFVDGLDFSSQVYYVDSGNKGDNSNPGTSSAPFKTIQYAINQLKANPDYDLLIRDGSYNETIFIKGLHGSQGNPVVIRSETPRGVVLKSLSRTKHQADQQKWRLPDSTVVIENSSHLKIAGLYVNGSRGFGIRVDNSSNILLKQNKTYNTGQSGIKARNVNKIDILWNEVQRPVQVFHQESLSVEELNNFRIIGNKVHDRPVGKNVYSLQSDYILTYPIGMNKAYYKKCFAKDPYDFEAIGKVRMQTECAVRGGEGIDVKNGSKNGEVAYNIVKDIQGKFGLYLDAWGIDDNGAELIQENIEIHHNIVTGSGTGMALSTENGSSEKGVLRNITIHNNIIVANQGAGFGMGNHGGYNNISSRIDKVRRVEDISVTNNLVLNNAAHGFWLANPHVNDIVIMDNVIARNADKQVFLANAVGQSSTDGYKYRLQGNVIDTTNRDYDWLNDAANQIRDMPSAATANGYLTDLPAVARNDKGPVDDVDTLIKVLASLR